MPTISIALATYNGERYVEAQLASIANQTVVPSEMIVADDGSQDGTLAIVRKFAESASFPVRIICNQARLGYRRNFMRAAAACTSDLIAFCDQDDIWMPNKINIMQEAFADPDVLLAYHNATLIDESGNAFGTTFRRRRAAVFDPLAIYPWVIIPGLAQVMRRSLLRLSPLHTDSIDPYELREPMPHDQWYPFWASVLGKIAYLPGRLAHYRQHATNESGWHAHYLAYAIDHVRNAESYVAGNAIGARNRLELLERCRNLLSDDEKAHVDIALPYYRALLIETERRLAIYRNKTIPSRMRALASVIASGTYTGLHSAAIGLDALLLDTFIGTLFRRLGRRG